MKIAITGTPGTGKSAVAKKLSIKTGIEIIDTNKIAAGIKEGIEVDVKKLRKLIMRVIINKKDFIIENHLLCEFNLPVDHVFILRCRPDFLLKRLKKRGYSKSKIGENLLAEMLDYCSEKTSENYKKFIEIETAGKTPEAIVNRIIALLKYKNRKGDRVDYTKYLIRYSKKVREWNSP